jgi:hypothetical protein
MVSSWSSLNSSSSSLRFLISDSHALSESEAFLKYQKSTLWNPFWTCLIGSYSKPLNPVDQSWGRILHPASIFRTKLQCPLRYVDDPCPVCLCSSNSRTGLDAIEAFCGSILTKLHHQLQGGCYSCHTWIASSATQFKSGSYTSEGVFCSLLSYYRSYQPSFSQQILWLVRPGLNAGSGSHDKASEPA